ncbi:tetratricopeptide repeat protein [Microvirga sesbaniae]|uniref:tetratricopeptide repeat protein n=1 Tax=Microvirga sesbaniae TaxID=681392 RepID=UPI0021C57217|nr:tetratricopeptide repeat protein [Microvirga sp. HBU67692]
MSCHQSSVHRPKGLLPSLAPDWTQGLFHPKTMTASRPHSARFHVIRGRILLGLGQYDRAIKDFRRAIRLDWRYERAVFWLDKASRTIPSAGETGSLT